MPSNPRSKVTLTNTQDVRTTPRPPKKQVIRTVQGAELAQKASQLKTHQENTFLTGLRKALSSGVVLAILLVGVLFRDIAYGEIFLLLYAIVAFICKVSSVTSFRMAFVMLLALPIVGVLNNHPLAQNFAVYGFLLLVIGIISALIEQTSMNRKEAKVLKSVVKKV